uniref:Uncharacterized protein n=1 Tax=Globisporangium ultimum (strain ATCC 200006 / CBS 805.95 / DAOM BR144) TaxID=431595 RepID=K3WJZ2_GLOUD
MARRNARQSAIDAVEEESDASDEESDGSSGSSGNESEEVDVSSSYDDDEDDDEEDEEEGTNDELKHASVRADIEEMQRMVSEMDKIKQRLQFRLEHAKQVKTEEEAWQKRQQFAAERQQEQQQEEKERAARIKQQQLQETQETASVADATGAPLSVAASSFADIGVQTEFSRELSHVERSQLASRMRDSQPSRPPAVTSEKTNAVESAKHASTIPAQGQSARLSLFDLGKSYGMKESRRSPTQRTSQHQPPSPIHDESHPTGSHDGDMPAVLSEASESDTFFIRRDSNRTSGRVNPADHHIDGFEEQQEISSSMADSFVRSDNLGSPVSAHSLQGRSSRVFQTLRNSILSSIDEADIRSSADTSHKPYYPHECSHAGSNTSVRASFNGEKATRTDGQREREAIQSLLFGR